MSSIIYTMLQWGCNSDCRFSLATSKRIIINAESDAIKVYNYNKVILVSL